MINAANVGFNIVTANCSDMAGVQATLNAALRQGVGVLVSADANASTRSLWQMQSEVGCHPNFAGFWLNGGTKVDPADVVTVGQLKYLRDAILQMSAHAFALVSAASAQAVLQISNETGLPMVVLELPASDLDGAKELAALRDALPGAVALPNAQPIETAFLAAVNPCAGSDGLARLQGYAAMLYGAAGVFYLPHNSDKCGAHDRNLLIAAVNRNIAQWSTQLAPTSARLSSLTQAVGEPDWKVPAGVSRNVASKTSGALIQEIGANLLVASFLPVNKTTGLVNQTLAPPLLLLLDTRTDVDAHSAQNTSLILDSSVQSWTPFVSDAEAGFPSCKKAVLGNAPSIALLPGEAMLIGLSQLESAPSTHLTEEKLWRLRPSR